MFALQKRPKTKSIFAILISILFTSAFLYSGLIVKRKSTDASNPVIAKQESVSKDSKPETLQGEEAEEKLQSDSKYKSLQEAIQESFYRIEKDHTGKTNAYYANNRSQRVSMKFEKGEAVLKMKVSEPKDEKKTESNKEQTRRLKQITTEAKESRKQVETKDFKVRFVAAGYGEKLQKVSGESEISSENNRLTYKHKLESSLIEEWYVNRSSGIEHGFTLNEPLSSLNASVDEKLRLEMELDLGGKFKARASGDGSGLILTDSKGREIAYEGLKVFDSDGKLLESRMSYSRGSIRIEFSDAGAKYPVTIDPTWTEVKKITASDAAATDRFGTSISISGDTAIVGAPGDDGSAGSDQGSAYIYERNTGGANNWGEVKHLFASDAATDDLFGISVSISVDTAIVGANLDDGSAGSSQGSAYIFERNTGGANNWGEVKHIFASDAAGSDEFGTSVSISGDTAIVGAQFDSGSAGSLQGSAYIFERNQGGANNWGEVKHIFASDAAGGDRFGRSVSIGGDTAIVGAYLDTNTGGAGQGSAYIFERNTGGLNNWGEVKHLFASDAAANDEFGISVSISVDTAIVGANLDDGSAGSSQGSAYIFERNTGGANNWGEVKHLFASDAAGNDRFGTSVSISGDTVIVGASFDSGSAGTQQGSAYVFVNQGGTWTQVGHAFASDAAAFDSFGSSVSISGDTAIVGARDDDGSGGSDQDSAYVYERNQGGANNWGEVKHIFASDAAADDEFGFSVSISGDTAIVGARADDGSAGNFQGSAYIYERNQGGANNWGEVKHLFASDAEEFDQFGWSVSISGDTAIVGAVADDGSAGAGQGSAYIYERNTGGANNWGEVKHIFASGANGDDRFGVSVSISGDTAIVGAEQDDISAGNQGTAYIYGRNQGGANNWGEVKRLLASDATSIAFFGESVSISGDTAIVGAWQHTRSGGSNQGSAYIFERNQGGANNWGEIKQLLASDTSTGDHFGWSVSISGDTAIVGARSDGGSAGNQQGSAYIFERNTGGANNWGEVKHLFSSDAVAFDFFGNSVSISGDTAIVGAFFDDGSAGSSQGSAYIFTITKRKTPLDFDGDEKSDYAVIQGTFSRPNNAQDENVRDGKVKEVVLSADLLAAERQRIWAQGYNKLLHLRAGRGFVPLPKDVEDAQAKWKSEGVSEAPSTEVVAAPVNWLIRRSSDGTTLNYSLGTETDTFVPADYDGDGKTDAAVWNSVSGFTVMQSSSLTTANYAIGVGNTNADPTVVGDYDGDGIDDPAIYDNTTGLWSWLGGSSHTAVGSTTWFADAIPAPGDYNGDGKSDFAVQLPPISAPDSAKFRIAFNDGSVGPAADISMSYGLAIYAIVPGDYDGDGKTDIAQANLSGTNIIWRVLTSSSNYITQVKTTFGVVATDKTAQGDYDGDGKIDRAVYRSDISPDDGVFRILQSSNAVTVTIDWGSGNDHPVGFFNTH